ncbi:MAG: RNA polymerase sigma factor [Candidatus Glassbacteria bacterium]
MEKLDILLAEANSGNKSAEEEIFEYLYVRFKVLATLKIGEGHSHDIAMEACKIILEKYKNVEFTKSFEAWTQGIFANVMRNYFRSSRIRKDHMVQKPEFENKMKFSSKPDHDLRLALIDCLQKILKIHPRYARAMNLVIHGYTPEEISRKLKISQNNCYVILNRGRALLRKCLESGRI